MERSSYMEYELEFHPDDYEVREAEAEGKRVVYRAFEHIVYVKRPADTAHQSLSIYVPEAYYEEGSFGGRTLPEAPIFMPNGVGGYRPGEIELPGLHPFTGKTNAHFAALERGYVVVSPAIRGIGLRSETNGYVGAAPACIVDYKAAVQYLRYNRGRVPGNVGQIISNGTSAGGGLSALLGTTGNHTDYKPYLEELGTAGGRDDIFAASCYCPITILEHADMAYEWEFSGLLEYHRMKFEMDGKKPKLIPVDGMMSALQEELSMKLKAMFPAYLNGLSLKKEDGTPLTLREDGSGSFQEYVESLLAESAQKALERGEDLTKLDWITLLDGTVRDVDFRKYAAFATRMKTTPAFDSIALDTPENELFGSRDIQCRHFTAFSQSHSTKRKGMAEEGVIRLMNPMNYINDPSACKARYFRIRHGAVDRDTSLAVPVILKTALEQENCPVDFHLPWGVPHAGDYDLEELFAWTDKVCGRNEIVL